GGSLYTASVYSLIRAPSSTCFPFSFAVCQTREPLATHLRTASTRFIFTPLSTRLTNAVANSWGSGMSVSSRSLRIAFALISHLLLPQNRQREQNPRVERLSS